MATYSEDGQWMWTGSEWIPAPPATEPVSQIIHNPPQPIPFNQFPTPPNFSNSESIILLHNDESSMKKSSIYGIIAVSIVVMIIIATIVFTLTEKSEQLQPKSVLISYTVQCSCDEVYIEVTYPSGNTLSWNQDMDGTPWTYETNITMMPGEYVWVDLLAQDRDSDWNSNQIVIAAIGANNHIVEAAAEEDTIATVAVGGMVTYEEHGDWLESSSD